MPLAPVLSSVIREAESSKKLQQPMTSAAISSSGSGGAKPPRIRISLVSDDTSIPSEGGKRIDLDCDNLDNGNDETVQVVFEQKDDQGKKVSFLERTQSRERNIKELFFPFSRYGKVSFRGNIWR